MVSGTESKLTYLVRGVLIDDPEFIFPLSLQQVTLYRSMDAKNRPDQTRAREQVKVRISLSHDDISFETANLILSLGILDTTPGYICLAIPAGIPLSICSISGSPVLVC